MTSGVDAIFLTLYYTKGREKYSRPFVDRSVYELNLLQIL